MTIQKNQDKQVPSNQTGSVRLPIDYFILPLCLSFQTPLFFFSFVVATIAAITDPINPQWLEVDWLDFVVRTILLVSFVGMCCRKEWALWLTIGVQTIYTLWVIGAIVMNFMGDPDPFLLLMYVYLIYELLIIAACFYALWQCAKFRRNNHKTPHPSPLPEGEGTE
jgi:hypothetical protein